MAFQYPHLADTAESRNSSGVTGWLASDTGLPVSQKNGPSLLVVMIRHTTGSAETLRQAGSVPVRHVDIVACFCSNLLCNPLFVCHALDNRPHQTLRKSPQCQCDCEEEHRHWAGLFHSIRRSHCAHIQVMSETQMLVQPVYDQASRWILLKAQCFSPCIFHTVSVMRSDTVGHIV